MTRPEQNEDRQPQPRAKSVAIEFSSIPPQSQWEESTPSQEIDTKTTDMAVHINAVLDVESQSAAPTRIAGRYLIMGELGSGGQATVYLAEDTTLRRKVAIKVSRPDRALSQDQQEQFKQEAQAIAALKHPGIVTVHDFGIDTDGRCYIVLEYLPGLSLRDCLKDPEKRKTFTIERTLGLISQVAQALHYAHQRGIYHRDLKPGNILLDEHGNPRITDFGLAVTQETQRGLKGQVAGTAAYMSPEQVRGEADWISGQADIWALGLILYEMLAGRRPFQGMTQSEIYYEILHRTPTPLRQINDQIPRELEEVARKCLEKEVGKRYSSGQDVAGRLAQVSLSGTVKQRHPAHRYRIWLAGVAVASVLVLLTSLNPFTKPADRRKDIVPGIWNDLLDRVPEPLVWQPGKESLGWTWNAKEQRVSLESKKLGLLKLADVPSANFELECQVRQARWMSNGGIGVFFGYRDEKIRDDDCKSIQAFVVSSIGSGKDAFFALERRRIVWPDGQETNTSNHTIAGARISPQDMEWLRVLFRVKNGRIAEVLVNNQPTRDLTSKDAQDMERLMEEGQGKVLDCRGPLGLYVDGRGRGISGEFRFVRIKPNP
jgi:serine/threonine protein kinase